MLIDSLRLSIVCFALTGLVRAQAIQFVVDRSDGAVYLKNESTVPAVIDGYSIESVDSALLVDNWTPISGNYDQSGDQSVDSSADWIVIADPSATTVSEASLVQDSGLLTAGQVVSLGLFFDTSLLEGLIVTTSAGGTTSSQYFADFRDLAGDYDGDLDVDSFDYRVWLLTFGSTTDLDADGNNDGIVDAADYTVWRNSLQLSEPAAALVSAAVPEPAGASALLVAVGLSSTRRRRR